MVRPEVVQRAREAAAGQGHPKDVLQREPFGAQSRRAGRLQNDLRLEEVRHPPKQPMLSRSSFTLSRRAFSSIPVNQVASVLKLNVGDEATAIKLDTRKCPASPCHQAPISNPPGTRRREEAERHDEEAPRVRLHHSLRVQV
jgi:hypothetical protein